MSMDPVAIRIEGLGKRYRIGRGRAAGTFREAVTEACAAPLRRLRAGLSSRSERGAPSRRESDFIWALRDVSLEVERGEVIGVIGPNGAGKTTLLKILSRITQPSAGRAEIRGRVGALLEVGTGFHPELTGRENIFLYGAILGMKRAEITRLFDEIIAFAEVDQFLDTPIKRYSSGMHVRLAFAVAAHLNPEILLIDEVLAVGDAAFQAKCLGKMGDVVKAGRTVLFVSHNLSAVGRLCPKTLLLSKGETACLGPTQEVLDRYLSSTFNMAARRVFEEDPAKEVQIRAVEVRNRQGEATAELDVEQPFTTEIEFEVKRGRRTFSLAWMLAVQDGTRVCESTDLDSSGGRYADHAPGLHRARVEFPGGVLNAGTYTIRVGIGDHSGAALDHQYGLQVHLHDHGTFATRVRGGRRLGLLLLNLPWQVGPVDGDA